MHTVKPLNKQPEYAKFRKPPNICSAMQQSHAICNTPQPHLFVASSLVQSTRRLSPRLQTIVYHTPPARMKALVISSQCAPHPSPHPQILPLIGVHLGLLHQNKGINPTPINSYKVFHQKWWPGPSEPGGPHGRTHKLQSHHLKNQKKNT